MNDIIIKEAFKHLIDKINIEITNNRSEINKEIEKPPNKYNSSKKKQLDKNRELLNKLLKKVENVYKYFNQNCKSIGRTRNSQRKERINWGLKTPEKEYYIPILEVIVELGGRGKVKEILPLVKGKMNGRLNDYDLSPLPGTKNERWHNTAQWARNDMVKEGYLCKDSPRGIWEITEKGKEFLKENKK